MSITTIREIQSILNKLTSQQRLAVEKQVDLKSINIMSLSERDAFNLLAKLKAAVATMTNPIRESINERQAVLDTRKAEHTAIWEDARKAYYTQLAKNDESIKGKQKLTDLFLNMQIAGEHMVDATKMANNSAIFGIITRDIGIG